MAELDLEELRDALAVRLRNVDGLTCYPYQTGQIQPPAAVVYTDDPLLERNTAQGVHLASFSVGLFVRLSSIEQGQRQLDRLIAQAVAALETVPDPVDVCGTVWVAQVGSHDEVTVSNVELLAARVDVQFYVRRIA